MFPSREQVKQVKEDYPPGTRIECLKCTDPYSPIPTGTRGTVKYVDDMGTIQVNWDNGRTLGLALGEDEYKKLN